MRIYLAAISIAALGAYYVISAVEMVTETSK